MNTHSHYYKDVRHLDTIDVYRVLQLFNVTDPCIQHAVKKLLVAGGRGAGKDIECDVKEAIDSLDRWNAMRFEESKKGVRPWNAAQGESAVAQGVDLTTASTAQLSVQRSRMQLMQDKDDEHQHAVSAGAANGN